MDKNTLCKEILDIREVLENNLKESLMAAPSLTIEDRDLLSRSITITTMKYFDIAVEKVQRA